MKLILLGYSGHGFVLAEAAIELGYKIIGYLEKKEKKNNPFNLSYLGYEEDFNLLNKYIKDEIGFIIGIGDNKIRTKIFNRIKSLGGLVETIIHPKTFVSNYSNIGNGVFVSKNSVINPLSEIKNNCIINTSSTIEHECLISKSVHIAPGVVVLGNVQIGKNSFIGSNSTIKEGIKIGNNVLIGAGSVVLKDVPDNKLCYGNPAKIIK